MPETSNVTRRDLLIRGGSAAVGLALFPSDVADRILRISSQEAVIPWIDGPQPGGRANTLDWQGLTSWVTPTEDLFRVSHYNTPEIDENDWTLEIGGLVNRPRNFTLEEIKALPKEDVAFALECGGNRGFPTFVGAVHNARWGGTSLRRVLSQAGIQEGGIEVVFFGTDEGIEEIRGNEVTQSFARSMSVEDSMDPKFLLCYEVNGEPLPIDHGFPLRLVAPGWYGVANVKWLKRIEVRNTRFMGRFMAQDYVTLRGEQQGGETVWTQNSVSHGRVNSIAAKVTSDGSRYRIHGAAWGADINRVEVQVDDGSWRPATLGEGRNDPYSWTFWHLDWDAESGEHTITSRATDREGNVQPALADPEIALKRTYWESNGQFTRSLLID